MNARAKRGGYLSAAAQADGRAAYELERGNILLAEIWRAKARAWRAKAAEA